MGIYIYIYTKTPTIGLMSLSPIRQESVDMS